MNKVNKLSMLALLSLSTVSALLLDGRPIVGEANANLTDFTQRGINALFEISDLANHIPESFVINKRSADDVR